MNWRAMIFPLLVSVVLVPVGARAAEVPADSRITAVTVFPDRAEVVRTVEIALPAGANTVLVNGLPASLIAQSVRVRGVADGALKIGSVETRSVFAEAAVRDEERRLNGRLEALQDQRRALDDRIAAARVQLNFINAIGRDTPRIANQELVEGKLDPEAWRNALALLGEGAGRAYDAIRTAEIEKRALERKIAKVQQDLNRVRTGRRASVTARINVKADEAASARLRLSYQLPGASWRPLYDARLDSETGRLELVQIGEVRQKTGEDWSGVALTLSTARPAASARLPQLAPWFIDFARLARSMEEERAPADYRLQDALQKRTEGVAGGEMANEPAAQMAAPVTARVVASEFAAEYRIPGEAAVASDNEPQKFVIAQRGFEAKLAVRTVPKVAAQAHLYGEVTFAGEEPWLPGPVSVFRDGAFVGTSAVSILRPGETFKLAFGVDDRVRVSYRLEGGERSREGIIDKDQRIERRYLIKVANHHKRPMEITVLDQLPVSRDERIEVDLLKGSTKPSVRDFDDRKGVVAWTETFAPDEERTIHFGYAVQYPDDQSVPGF